MATEAPVAKPAAAVVTAPMRRFPQRSWFGMKKKKKMVLSAPDVFSCHLFLIRQQGGHTTDV
jgi:hypothetical protein